MTTMPKKLDDQDSRNRAAETLLGEPARLAAKAFAMAPPKLLASDETESLDYDSDASILRVNLWWLGNVLSRFPFEEFEVRSAVLLALVSGAMAVELADESEEKPRPERAMGAMLGEVGCPRSVFDAVLSALVGGEDVVGFDQLERARDLEEGYKCASEAPRGKRPKGKKRRKSKDRE